MRIKVYTENCKDCNYFSMVNSEKNICEWGQGKKRLVSPKGKGTKKCKLVAKDK